jgi:Cu-Zn family superoxide dismutase
MKKAVYLLQYAFLLISGSIVVSCNNGSTDAKTEEKPAESVLAEASVTGTKSDTTVTGTARFTQADGKVKFDLSLTIPSMANDTVAVHIHEHGDCGDAGKNTHGHWNPTGKQHGKWGTGDFHSGDIGNVILDASGKGTASLETDLWSIGGDITKDILGKAIIVHSGVDDFTTQPTGNAGSRIGCGLIEKK